MRPCGVPVFLVMQVMITVGSIYWTLETEEVLTASDGNKARKGLRNQ